MCVTIAAACADALKLLLLALVTPPFLLLLLLLTMLSRERLSEQTHTCRAVQAQQDSNDILLWLAAPGVCNQKRPVVLHKNLLDLPLCLLVNDCTSPSNHHAKLSRALRPYQLSVREAYIDCKSKKGFGSTLVLHWLQSQYSLKL